VRLERQILLKRRCYSADHGYQSTEYSLNVHGSPLRQDSPKGLGAEISPALVTKCPQQKTLRQKTYETFSKTVDNSQALREKELLGQIMIVCQDVSSFPYYRKLVSSVCHQAIYSALSQVREAKKLGRVKSSPGAMFTDLVKRYQDSIGVSSRSRLTDS
jgi:hypothetical protein